MKAEEFLLRLAYVAATMNWERIQLPESTAKYLRGTHDLWTKMSAGERIFVVLPKSQEPTEGNSGYRSIRAAMKAKGFIE